MMLEQAVPDSVLFNFITLTRLEQFWGFWPRKVAEMLGSTGAAPMAWC
jgi:hypothetical protein